MNQQVNDLINMGMFVSSGLPFLCGLLKENTLENPDYKKSIDNFIDEMKKLNIIVEIVNNNIIIKNQYSRVLFIIDYTKQNINDVYTKQSINKEDKNVQVNIIEKKERCCKII